MTKERLEKDMNNIRILSKTNNRTLKCKLHNISLNLLFQDNQFIQKYLDNLIFHNNHKILNLIDSKVNLIMI